MQGTKLESLSYCEWECMFREMALFVVLWKAIKPEQHMNIEVCGSGLFIIDIYNNNFRMRYVYGNYYRSK